MRFSRRAFLAALAATTLAGPTAAAEEPITRSWTWRGATNQVISSPIPFTAAAVSWPSPAPTYLRLRVSADGASWSAWQPVTTHEQHGRPAANGRWFGDLAVVPSSRLVEVASDGPAVELQIDLIDSSAGPTTSVARASLGTTVPIILRAEWGCDERLRFDSSGHEIWPPERYVVEKVVLHHTATANSETNPAATVRSIYYYHAVTQGWGDIGYNYLVDWRGNVYEGRYGGAGVEAGHAYGHNPHSIGIACLGTFDSASITSAMRTSLARLIAQVAPYIDPHDDGYFVDGPMPNLMGHRDAMQYRPLDATECPGDSLYALLPGLRGDVAFNLGTTPTPAATILDVSYQPTTLVPGSTLAVTVTLKNTGTATLSTQGPPAAFTYAEADTSAGRGFPGQIGAWRVALDLTGGGAAADYPFRWGLPTALEPGQTAVVRGQVTLAASGTRRAALGIVRESRAWALRAASPATIAVVDPASLGHRLILPVAPRRSRP
jgi:hypothetical protein